MACIKKKRVVGWALALGVIVILVVLYTAFDPAANAWFPKCLFRMLTGLECPGCGSQRAVHNLLNLDIGGALAQNVLMVTAIPYVVAGFVFDLRGSETERALRWRKRLFGTTAIWIIFTVIILFTILRNIPFFGQWL